VRLLPESVADGAELRDVVAAQTARAALQVIADRHALRGELVRCDRGSDLVFALEDTVVKLTDPRWTVQIDTEVAFLEALGGELPVNTADVVARGSLEGWPYVVMSRLPGEHLDDAWPSMSHDARLGIAEQIGELITSLHAIPVAGAPAHPWPDWVASRRAAVIGEQRERGAPEPWLEAIDEFLAVHGDPYGGELAAASLHTELLDTHLFVEHVGGRIVLSGLIDFADGMIGAPSYEVAGVVEFIFKAEAGLLTRCLESAGWRNRRDTAEAERLFACSLLHRFASVPRMLRAAKIDESRPVDIGALISSLYRLTPNST